MALSACNTVTDRTGRELVQHGTTPFPIACYHDDFTVCDVPWHWHQELEAVVLTAGSCLVCAGGEKYNLKAGEGFFINSGVLHGCWDLVSTGCRFHSLVFHPRLVGGSLDSVFQHAYLEPLMNHPSLEIVPLFPGLAWQREALDAIEAAWQQCFLEPEGYEFRVRNSLSELIYLLYRNLPQAPVTPDKKSQRDGERIKAMLSRIHASYQNELTTADIAAAAAISESECLRCFRHTIGTTPIQYLKQYRIQQAAQKLLESGERVADIATACGYQDISYFTKTFRQVMGLSPSAYRDARRSPEER